MNMSGRVLAVAALVALAAIVAIVASTAGADEPAGGAANSTVTGDALPEAVITAPVDTVPPPELPRRGVHPPLRDIDGWLQSDVTSLEELRGQVVAVQFWTFGCSNCKATLEHLRKWYADHHDEGFEIVGVHSPEFSYEADVDNIVEAAAELDVTWPIALDPTKHTFHDWQEGPRAFWPPDLSARSRRCHPVRPPR